MTNYKKLKFYNTLDEFRSWCRIFPPLQVGEHREHFKHDSYYCSMEVVIIKPLISNPVMFVGKTFRMYDPISKDFVILNTEQGYEIFKEEIEEYHRRWDMPIIRH